MCIRDRDKACAAVFAQNESGDIFGIYAAQVGKHFIEAGGVQKSTGTDQKISGIVEFLLCNISKNVHWIWNIDNNGRTGVSLSLIHIYLDKLYQEMKEKGVGVVGMVIDSVGEDGTTDEDTVKKAQILKEKTGVTYPLLIPDAGNMNGRISGCLLYTSVLRQLFSLKMAHLWKKQ